MTIKDEKLLDMYRTMVRIRNFEERAFKEFGAGNLPGFVHLYAGEEAIATGACANLRRDDYVTSTHRPHGHYLAKGGDMNKLMAEIWGKKTGCCKGKGGSMHVSSIDVGMLGGNGIVGAGISLAGGAALASKMKGTDQVTLCFFSDGANNTTRYHEGINLASVWNLPVVYIIENNFFAQTVRVTESTKVVNLADRACAYCIPGVTVDGNDVMAVYEAVGTAVARARKGEGPSLVECRTYLRHGHYVGDDCVYMPKEELEEWMTKLDPIPRFRSRLIELKVLTKKSIDEIEKGIAKEIDEAVHFAQESPFPDPEETLDDLFV